MNETPMNVYLQAVQVAAYCWMIHWMLWQHCSDYKAWCKKLQERLREQRTHLSGRMAHDIKDALESAGL